MVHRQVDRVEISWLYITYGVNGNKKAVQMARYVPRFLTGTIAAMLETPQVSGHESLNASLQLTQPEQSTQ